MFYNSVVMIDANGMCIGKYRKSHIPDGPGYQEKFYFSPGDTGFKVFQTTYGKIGVAICWDQWFPEAARCMALQGELRDLRAMKTIAPLILFYYSLCSMIYKACLIVPSRLPLYIIYCTFDFLFLLVFETFSVLGADLILYPTAIGSEPTSPEYDSSAHWERVMVGHSAANMIPIVATNRVGTEKFSKSSITFYGWALLDATVS